MSTRDVTSELRAELDTLRTARAMAIDELDRKLRECDALRERVCVLERELADAVRVFDTDRARWALELKESRSHIVQLAKELEDASHNAASWEQVAGALLETVRNCGAALDEYVLREQEVKEALGVASTETPSEFPPALDLERYVVPSDDE